MPTDNEKKMMKYVHTIDGKLATYHPGEQISYHADGRKISFCHNLNQIRREQRASTRWRIRRGFKPFYNYGYVRISELVPSDPVPSHARRPRKGKTK